MKIKIATFNVRGLVDNSKRVDLTKDMESYHVDVCCLQETKVIEQIEELTGGYKIILVPSKQRHYGTDTA